ncbi:HAD family hydrolase [Pelotomaculum propionicicum]|uniref:HAD family hydrolase n=1 Tax=Pelotomaculum propionicicum TaxID=258475 RepID=UPI003B7758C7
MITIDIPGLERLIIKNIVLDFNGTIALDGALIPGVKEKLNSLAGSLDIYILTADTFGTVLSACSTVLARVIVLKGPIGSGEKLKFIENLGIRETAAIGNGANDVLMLEGAALGIAVTGPEGTCARALMAADVVVKDINDGLDLFLNPQRLVATLRR